MSEPTFEHRARQGSDLVDTVQSLAVMAAGLPESELERPWSWKSYKSEGVRLAFFRVMEELRSLAVRLVQARQAAGRPLTQTQRILGQYHVAWRELQAVLLGLDPPDFEQAPAEDEWPIRQTLAHILGADLGFYVLISHALECHHAASTLTRIPNEAWERLLGLSEAEYDSLLKSPAAPLLANYTHFHARILDQFSKISDAELELPAYYWEKESHLLRFRLHRFESHTRQHTIQIEKTLAATGRLPAEPKRLARLIYSALAEVENARLGAEDLGEDLTAEVSNQIVAWMREIQAI